MGLGTGGRRAFAGRTVPAVTVLLWWSLASIAVSLVVGALLALGQSEPETIDLDLISAQLAASRAAGATSQPATAPLDTAGLHVASTGPTSGHLPT